MTNKLSKIKLVVMDVDGTLTDGTVYYSKEGELVKRFSIRDGMGIELLRKSNIQTMIMTSENSPIAQARGDKLKIDYIILGCRDKSGKIKEFSIEKGISLDEICFIGDDINDLHAMRICGIAACPNNAVDAIKHISNIISNKNGGDGAVREVIELILTAKDLPLTINENW